MLQVKEKLLATAQDSCQRCLADMRGRTAKLVMHPSTLAEFCGYMVGCSRVVPSHGRLPVRCLHWLALAGQLLLRASSSPCMWPDTFGAGCVPGAWQPKATCTSRPDDQQLTRTQGGHASRPDSQAEAGGVQAMHKEQVATKRNVLQDASAVDDMYDLLLLHKEKLTTADEVGSPCT